MLVTSPCSGDGKTLCTVSLAAALVADGKRVLVVEADMHKPSLGALFGFDPPAGLADLLTGRSVWADVVVSVPSGTGAFDVIASPVPQLDSTELLSNSRFAELIRYARSEYEFVLIDSPPFPLVADTLILARYADQALSVLRFGNTGAQRRRRAPARPGRHRRAAGRRRRRRPGGHVRHRRR